MNEVKTKINELGIDSIWNADQTAVNYEILPRRKINQKGVKTVWIKSAGKEKERVSVLLLGSSKSEKKPPFIIFKGKPSRLSEVREFNDSHQHGFGNRVWKEIQQVSKDTETETFCNENASFTSKLMTKWLEYQFSNHIQNAKILLFDYFSAHWTEVITTAK